MFECVWNILATPRLLLGAGLPSGGLQIPKGWEALSKGGHWIYYGREWRLVYLTMLSEQAWSINKILELLYGHEFLIKTSCTKGQHGARRRRCILHARELKRDILLKFSSLLQVIPQASLETLDLYDRQQSRFSEIQLGPGSGAPGKTSEQWAHEYDSPMHNKRPEEGGLPWFYCLCLAVSRSSVRHWGPSLNPRLMTIGLHLSRSCGFFLSAVQQGVAAWVLPGLVKPHGLLWSTPRRTSTVCVRVCVHVCACARERDVDRDRQKQWRGGIDPGDAVTATILES